MPKQIVILSGHVCAGKSTLAERLRTDYGLIHLKTQNILREYKPDVEPTRTALQHLGESLDKRTRGAWVRDALTRTFQAQNIPSDAVVVVDAARIQGQIDAIRNGYGRQVVHIHLTAPMEELKRRYKKRKKQGIKELSSYARVQENSTERQVDQLQRTADVVIDTKRCTVNDVVTRSACHLGLYGKEYLRLVDVLVGGQFGSEGKGQVAAYLASDYDVLVRVGGPNAGHTVYGEPKHQVYRHLPSGTRTNSQAQIVLGPGAVLYLPVLQREIGECSLDFERLSIDPQAMVISDADRESEGALKSVIGSTGQGVGAATARKIMGRSDETLVLARHVPELKPFIRDTCRILDKAFRHRQRVLLEGTQGTGLSIHHGFYPHVTSRDTTVAGCLAEAGISPSRVRKVVMVCRTYPIRVQSPEGKSSGPMSQEITWREIARRSQIPFKELKKHEITTTTHRPRRVGEFDWELLRKAASLNAPTDIALTFADYLNVKNREARRFEQLDDASIRFIEEVERVAGAPVTLISTRFHSRSIIDRRSW